MEARSDTVHLNPPEQGRWGGPLAIALGVHGLLILALAWGVAWQKDTQVVLEAELWSRLPQVAAPRPVEPPPPPPAQNATNSDELFTRFDADSSGNISQDELSSLLEAVAQQTPSRTGSQEDADSGLIAKLLKQYQDGAGYRTSVGSQVNISA